VRGMGVDEGGGNNASSESSWVDEDWSAERAESGMKFISKGFSGSKDDIMSIEDILLVFLAFILNLKGN
jgi:hypothetical protein